MRDPYESLALPRSATAADIKKSFRELAKRLHPDANNNDSKAAALFAELNAAHEILGDEEKRRAFDMGEIDADGKPTRRVNARRSRPSTGHIATRLLVVMVMLAATATLIMRSLTLQEIVNARSHGGDAVSSPVVSDEEQTRAAPPEQPDPGVQSKPRLILAQDTSYAAADSIPLGIQVDDETVGLALEISGLPSGATISSGRDLGAGGWRILATDLGTAAIHPPPDFSGSIDLAIELRLIDDTVVDRGSLHLEGRQKPTTAPAPIDSAAVASASESSTDAASVTTAPTDQKTIETATDSKRNHEPVELLIGRSEKLLAAGEVEAARILLHPAAEAHDARAALALGATYDPVMLAILQARDADADVSLALDWYKKAREFGSVEAQKRLKLLSTVLTGPKRHLVRRPMHVQATAAPSSPDPNGVYIAGARVGSDPDPSIRAQLLRDDAGRQLRTKPDGTQDSRER
jgi:hypothetical protein